MNAKSIGFFIATLLSLIAGAQEGPNVRNLLGLFSGEQKWMLPAVDSSLCVIRQEYTLIDSGGNEFGADGKSYWGAKYGLGVITDSGVYTLGSLLTDEKGLEDASLTDPRRLRLHLSKRFYKRSADNGFREWKAKVPAGTGTGGSDGTPDSKKNKKDKKGQAGTDAAFDAPVQLPEQGAGGKATAAIGRFSGDSLFVSLAVPDSVSSVSADVNSRDTSGWLVLVNGKFGGAVTDTSQLAYTVIKPSYLGTGSSVKTYIKKPGAVRQNLLGGVYYTARFSCGKIVFAAAGLLSQDEKGWFIRSFAAKGPEAPAKPAAAAITPIKSH